MNPGVGGVHFFPPALSPHLSLAKDKKKDPEEIGKRDVGRGINFARERSFLGLQYLYKTGYDPDLP